MRDADVVLDTVAQEYELRTLQSETVLKQGGRGHYVHVISTDWPSLGSVHLRGRGRVEANYGGDAQTVTLLERHAEDARPCWAAGGHEAAGVHSPPQIAESSILGFAPTGTSFL